MTSPGCLLSISRILRVEVYVQALYLPVPDLEDVAPLAVRPALARLELPLARPFGDDHVTLNNPVYVSVVVYEFRYTRAQVRKKSLILDCPPRDTPVRKEPLRVLRKEMENVPSVIEAFQIFGSNRFSLFVRHCDLLRALIIPIYYIVLTRVSHLWSGDISLKMLKQ